MDIDGEQPIALQNAAHDLITHPPPGSGVLTGKHARHGSVLETITKEGLERLIAFLLGSFEYTAVEEPIRRLIVADNQAIPDIKDSPNVFLIME
ncbi:hypothetical protein D3C77_591200 [compost metagenome]